MKYQRMLAIMLLTVLLAGMLPAHANLGSQTLLLPEEDDGIAFLLSGNQERVYLMGYDFQLYRYEAGAPAMEPLTPQSPPNREGGGLLAFCEINGALYIQQYGDAPLRLIYQEGSGAPPSILLPLGRDVKHAHSGSSIRHLEHREGYLWFLTDARNNDQLALCRYDLKAGKIKVFDSEPGLYDYCLLGDGQVLLSDKLFDNNRETGRLRLLDVGSGKVKQLTTLDARTDAMAYDAEDSSVLFISQSALWRYPLQGKPSRLRSMPVGGNGMQNPAFMMAGRMLSIYPRGLYLALPQGQDGGKLHIIGEGPSMGYQGSNYDAFMQVHPDVALSYQHSISPTEQLSTGELGQRIQTGMLNYDVMALNTQVHDLEALIRKGYCLDLSDDPALLAAVRRMYPAIAEQVIYQDRLYAIPARVDGINSLEYHPETLAQLGLSQADIPTSYEEMIDWVADWQYIAKGQDIRPFQVQDVAALLKDRLITRYIDHCYSQGLPLSFNNPLFIDTLNQLDSKRLPRFPDQIPGVLSDSGSGLLQAHVMTLSIAQDGPHLQPARLFVYIINAQTENRELALEYLRMAVANQQPAYQAALYADWTDPVEHSGYPQWLAEQLAEEDKLQQAVLKEESGTAGRRSAQERLDAHLARRQKQETIQRYQVSPEALRNYQQALAPYLYFPPVNPFTSYREPGGESIYRDVQRYLKGQLSASQLAETLDQKARLMMLEQDR